MKTTETTETTEPQEKGYAWPDYRSVWRWHFYAGLFCIPFVVMLSISGTIYLFKTEIESWLDRPYDQLQVSGKPANASSQIKAVLAAFPGSRLQSYELPQIETDSVRVVVQHEGKARRVYVHPQTLEILHSTLEESRFIRVIFKLHGELLMGNRGSALVELASSWAIVMIITGLFLWWPRGTKRLGGILYPRIFKGSRTLWRDLHSVTGFWISGLALILLMTGLPWAKFWGDYFKQVRRLTGTAVARQDWTNGAVAVNKSDSSGSSAEHDMHTGPKTDVRVGRDKADKPSNQTIDLTAVDRIIATLKPLALPPPVVISPPGSRSFEGKNSEWTAKSMTANRPKRVDLVMDPATGAVASRKDFKDRHLIDQIVGTGIAAHEGRLFGWPNQLLGVLTAIGLILVSVSSVFMWLGRRQPGTLGAPAPISRRRRTWALLAVMIALAIALPMFGFSLLVVLLMERYFLKKIPGLGQWLGLSPGRPSPSLPKA
jgi:uncharacterized iron-regulated membrane protein